MKYAVLFALLTAGCFGQYRALYPFNVNEKDVINGYDSTVTNVTYVAGVHGNSAKFNGNNTFMRKGTLGLWSPTAYTLSYWFYIDGNGTGTKAYWTHIVRSNGSSSYNETFHTGTRAITNPRGTFYRWGITTPNSEGQDTSGVHAQDSKWHYLVATHNGTTGSLYLDGKLQMAVNLGINPTRAMTTVIGYWNQYNDYFNGKLDEMLIAQDCWTAGRIKTMYAYYKGFL